MLELAAEVRITKELSDSVLTAAVRVKNVGPPHAIPTGEPLRSLVLRVVALCGTELLSPVGGDVVPDFGGYTARRVRGESWSTWPGAEVDDVIRVVAIADDFHDYPGFGPFGDGTFTKEEKGMPLETWVGEARVISVQSDGAVELDAPLPVGDRAYLIRPREGEEAWQGAGAPGFGFARVMAGANGDRMVPHFAAVDVVSDNRLLSGGHWTSSHHFLATCDSPKVKASLLYRRFPLAMVRSKSAPWTEEVMVEVVR